MASCLVVASSMTETSFAKSSAIQDAGCLPCAMTRMRLETPSTSSRSELTHDDRGRLREPDDDEIVDRRGAPHVDAARPARRARPPAACAPAIWRAPFLLVAGRKLSRTLPAAALYPELLDAVLGDCWRQGATRSQPPREISAELASRCFPKSNDRARPPWSFRSSGTRTMPLRIASDRRAGRNGPAVQQDLRRRRWGRRPLMARTSSVRAGSHEARQCQKSRPCEPRS